LNGTAIQLFDKDGTINWVQVYTLERDSHIYLAVVPCGEYASGARKFSRNRKKEQHREDVQLTAPVVVKKMRSRLPKEGQMYRATPELDEKGTLWIVA